MKVISDAKAWLVEEFHESVRLLGNKSNLVRSIAYAGHKDILRAWLLTLILRSSLFLMLP